MKYKRLLSTLLMAIMVCTLALGTSNYEVKAEEDTTYEEGDVTTEDSSEGEMEWSTWGVYLKSGTSSITKLASGKITAGGKTVGQKVVDKIYVGVRVQRKVNGSWTSYSFWSASATDSAYVSTSKTLTVPSGYYYRVYCDHTANSDASSSFTSGIWID